MKTLKFRESLSKLILKGEKNTTWRLFDDKNLSVGEVISFLVWETKEEFAKAVILNVKETRFGDLSKEDWEGHERFLSNEEMYDTYSKYYNRQVDKNSPVKIIKFKLLQNQLIK
ncbi:MAG: ASCH domain-containing protein [Candidatus Nanoarchaeia archaeon]|nr:ASCH domain-containing protein [Candidatus Nanoarchaeia archaeon]